MFRVLQTHRKDGKLASILLVEPAMITCIQEQQQAAATMKELDYPTGSETYTDGRWKRPDIV